MGGGLHCALGMTCQSYKLDNVTRWPHTILLDKEEANEQSHVTECD